MGSIALYRVHVATLTLLFAATPTLHAAALDPLLAYTGPQLYQRFCASCHGPQAYGDGPVAPTLKVMVPDLTRIARRQQGGEFPEERIREIVDGRALLPAHGLRDMPVWGWDYTIRAGEQHPGSPENQAAYVRTRITALLEYLNTLQVK